MQCYSCKSQQVSLQCNGCNRTVFCSSQCQHDSWSDHRSECLQFQQIEADYDKLLPDWRYYPHFWDVYVVEKTLGTGAFGQVYLARSAKDQKLYAVKVVTVFDRLRNDVAITTDLQRKHPEDSKKYIANIIEYGTVPHRDPVRKYVHFDEINFAIVMEYIKGETLNDVEIPQARFKKSAVLQDMFTSALEALVFLHENNVIHGDLKPENMMKASKDDRIVLLDLGLADYSDAEDPVPAGTPIYFAPELIPRTQANTKKTDMFALALSFYDMIEGDYFHRWVDQDAKGNITFDTAAFEEDIEPAIAQIAPRYVMFIAVLKAMLNTDPEKRPTAVDALADMKITS